MIQYEKKPGATREEAAQDVREGRLWQEFGVREQDELCTSFKKQIKRERCKLTDYERLSEETPGDQ